MIYLLLCHVLCTGIQHIQSIAKTKWRNQDILLITVHLMEQLKGHAIHHTVNFNAFRAVHREFTILSCSLFL